VISRNELNPIDILKRSEASGHDVTRGVKEGKRKRKARNN
jgi:hypothetical protein